MSSETTPDVTWQKIAVLITVLIVAAPFVGRFAWHILFPTNRLLYTINEPIEGEGVAAVSIEIVNDGQTTQNGIVVSIPKSWNPDEAYLDISTPRRLSLPSADGKPSKLIKLQEKGYVIPVGSLRQNEKIRISLIAISSKEGNKPSWGMYETRVESATTLGLEADGSREPEFEDSLHGMYFQAAPYLLAVMLSFIGFMAAFGFIFDTFFDTKEKKITRLWKQMNLLQEQIEKERWRR